MFCCLICNVFLFGLFFFASSHDLVSVGSAFGNVQQNVNTIQPKQRKTTLSNFINYLINPSDTPKLFRCRRSCSIYLVIQLLTQPSGSVLLLTDVSPELQLISGSDMTMMAALGKRAATYSSM